MRIDRLKIGNSQNLEDVDINFDEGSLETVVIGQNGSGQSNVIEAIATIFRDLDDARAAAKLQYELEYECKGHRIKIDSRYSNDSASDVWIDGKKSTLSAS